MTGTTMRIGSSAKEHHGTRVRVPALDGLRGVAAVVVLVHHSLLCVPALAVVSRPDEPGARSRDVTSLAWWLMHSPLHLAWAGTEAVFVFFVLSGLVLVMAVLNSTRFQWRTYYPRRLIRIYLPVFGALLVALATITLVPREDMAALSPWLNHVSGAPTWRSFLKDSLLLSGTESLVGPLWSLRWEMAFSLLLPAYVVVVRRTSRQLQVWLVVAALVASYTGYKTSQSVLLYMPMFAVGALLAVHRDHLHTWWAARPTWPQSFLLVAALGSLIAPWMVVPWVTPWVTGATMGLPLVGAAGVVVLAAVHPGTSRLLCSRVAQTAGRTSFSLYLVHEPIVIAAGTLLGPGNGWWVLPTAGPAAVVAAVVFHRFVEAPSHRLAQSVLRR